MTIALPLFATDSVTYVHWDPMSSDISSLDLHRESLSVPPPLTINYTVITDLDALYAYYDDQLSSALEKADGMIDQIDVTSDVS